MIHIIDDWYVDVDESQYISGIMYARKDGKQELKRKNYHSTLRRAVERIESERKCERLSKGAMELKEALEILRDIEIDFFQELVERMGL